MLGKKFKYVLGVLLVAMLTISLIACGSNKKKSVKVKRAYGKVYRVQKIYIVRKGDSLGKISKKVKNSYKSLAARNRLRHPYKIYPGQRIKYVKKHSGYSGLKPARKRKVAVNKPNSVSYKHSKKNNAIKTTKRKRNAQRIASNLKWNWPASGKIINNYYSGKSKLKGLNIVSYEGAPVRAAASGRVVYSGNALRGYGNLIIIKHNETYLTAYAHNHKIFVKEGQRVKIGQQIAKMGKTGTNKVMLHFEVRRNGKPIDPSRVLPGSGK